MVIGFEVRGFMGQKGHRAEKSVVVESLYVGKGVSAFVKSCAGMVYRCLMN